MHDAYVNICEVPTRILSWGCWIEESLSEVDELVICITGNPGVPGFYNEFLGSLFNKLGKKIPIWVIGHAGHDIPPEGSIRKVPNIKGNEHIFNLSGQVKHKTEFIEKYVPAHVKIHLVGHSIGTWMILQLLSNEQIRRRLRKCYMLYPTIERMIDSPNGWIITKIAVPVYTLFSFAIVVFNRLPIIVRIFLIHIYFWITSIPSKWANEALTCTKTTVLENIIFLAKDEMVRVRELQTNIISDNLQLLKFYYGTTDGWVPVKYYKQIKQLFPSIDAELDEKNIKHTFVLESSVIMSEIVSCMIKENVN